MQNTRQGVGAEEHMGGRVARHLLRTKIRDVLKVVTTKAIRGIMLPFHTVLDSEKVQNHFSDIFKATSLMAGMYIIVFIRKAIEVQSKHVTAQPCVLIVWQN